MRFTLAIVAGCLLSAGVAGAAEPAKSSVKTKPVANGEQGMRVYRDPTTGELTSTPPAGAQQIDATAQPEFGIDRSKVTVERRADGTIIDHMNGQGEQVLTVHRDARGKLVYSCGDINRENAILQATAPAQEISNER
jgi:hypothetical protein